MNSALAKRSRADLAKYDPQKGLKTLAVAEAAEKHYARAKDATKLQEAIRIKLTAQAEFVFWWDTKGPGAVGPGQPKKNRNGSDAILSKAGKNGLPSTMIVSRWRRKLNDPDSFETTFDAACARYIRIIEFDTTHVRGIGLSLAEEWYTPERYLEAARHVLGAVDLDPASSFEANKRVRAKTFFSADDDGLTKEWPGRVWLNPPYVGEAGPFTERLVQQHRSGITTAAILLVNAHATDTAWFQPLWDFLLCFTNHRINFISNGQEASGSNHGSVFVYLGPERRRFIERFGEFGAVVGRVAQ